MTDARPCPPGCLVCPMIDRPLTPALVAAIRAEYDRAPVRHGRRKGTPGRTPARLLTDDEAIGRVIQHLDATRWTTARTLGERMNLSRDGAITAIRRARASGAAIESRHRCGYRLGERRAAG